MVLDSIILAISIRHVPKECLITKLARGRSAVCMGLIQKAVGWILALVILAMFPWLLPLALAYWAWKKGILKSALRRVSGWAKERDLRGWITGLDASVSTGLSPNEAVIRYEAPFDDSPFIVVQRGGEKRIVIASSLREEAGTRSDYGAVVASIIDLLGGFLWSINFSFSLSRGGETMGLIALDRPAPESWTDLKGVSREVMGQIEAVERAVGAVAPSLTVRVLKGKDLAPVAMWRTLS